MFAPSDVAPIMMGVQILSGLQTFSSDRHFIDWSCVTPMALASSVTAIIGVLALIKVDTDQVRLVMSLIVSATVVILVSGWRYHRAPHVGTSLGVGATSGLLNRVFCDGRAAADSPSF